MKRTSLFQQIKQLATSLFGFTGLLICVTACSGDDAVFEEDIPVNGLIQSEALPDGWKTVGGEMDANKTQYEGMTRSAETTWVNGSKIYFMIESGQNKIPVVAVYSTTFDTWSFSYDATATIPSSGTMKGCYLEGTTASSFTEASLCDTSLVYIDAKASYTFAEEAFTVTVNLKPSYVRLRFAGSEGQNALFQGMNYVSHFDAETYTFKQEPIIMNLTATEAVNDKYYTPYVCGYLNADGKIYLTTGSYSYGRTLESGKLNAGESGWMTMPADNYIPKGWSVQEAPSLADYIVWGTGVTTEQKEVITKLAKNMVYVAGGTFAMGATSEQGTDYNADERPTHNVTLSSYYINKFEVTQKEYNTIMGTINNSWSSSYGYGDNYPAYYCSWDSFNSFITTLNTLSGLNFKFPTEAEWEYAARGGNKSKGYKYCGTSDANNLSAYARYYSYSSAAEVGQLAPNELGLYDMSGNVRELVYDWYGSFGSSALTNPTGPVSGSYKITRGGSYDDAATCCRVSCRYYYTMSPTSTNRYTGFRVACSLSK